MEEGGPTRIHSFEFKALAQDDPKEDESLRALTESERLARQVSEMLAMLGEQLKVFGITQDSTNLDAKFARLPEHMRM
jgi:hypothetical protein